VQIHKVNDGIGYRQDMLMSQSLSVVNKIMIMSKKLKSNHFLLTV